MIDFGAQAEAMLKALAESPYIPIIPTGPQLAFLLHDAREALYGGAAGGGKTDALLAAALLFVHVPKYNALLTRRTFPELAEADGLIPRAKDWLNHTRATYHEGRKQWHFPGGATLSFRHIQNEKAIPDRGPQYQFIGYDELTTFAEPMYRRMFSRLRGPADGPLSLVPLRMRGATNPGGEGHVWVKDRFIDNPVDENGNPRPFVRARVKDNPHIDRKAYIDGLRAGLDPITLARMLDGDWEVSEGGALFNRGDFQFAEEAPADCKWVRSWDLAATTGEKAKFTAGVLIGRSSDGRYFIQDVKRFRERPQTRDAIIRSVAEGDGRAVHIRLEQEGGSAGVKQSDDHIRMLAGFSVEVSRDTGDKFTRAGPLASQVGAGNVWLITPGKWIGPFLDELHAAQPGAKFLDQMDAVAAGFNYLTGDQPLFGYSRKRKKRSTPPAKRSERLSSNRPRMRLR